VRGVPILPKVFNRLSRLVHACDISYRADIEKSVVFAHRGLGVVVGDSTVIGARTKVSSNVTIGGRGGRSVAGRTNPVIGADVLIGTGARILGPVLIGDGCAIGANAVVMSDVPAGCTAVGIPARVIEGRGDDAGVQGTVSST